MQPQNHGSSLKQTVNRNCKVLSSNQEKPCNLKPAQNRKIDSRSAAYAFFTSDYLLLTNHVHELSRFPSAETAFLNHSISPSLM